MLESSRYTVYTNTRTGDTHQYLFSVYNLLSSRLSQDVTFRWVKCIIITWRFDHMWRIWQMKTDVNRRDKRADVVQKTGEENKQLLLYRRISCAIILERIYNTLTIMDHKYVCKLRCYIHDTSRLPWLLTCTVEIWQVRHNSDIYTISYVLRIIYTNHLVHS